MLTGKHIFKRGMGDTGFSKFYDFIHRDGDGGDGLVVLRNTIVRTLLQGHWCPPTC